MECESPIPLQDRQVFRDWSHWMNDFDLCSRAIGRTSNGMLLSIFSKELRGSRYLVELAVTFTPDSISFADDRIWLFDPNEELSKEAAIDFTAHLLKHGCPLNCIPTAHWELLWSKTDCIRHIRDRRELWGCAPSHIKKTLPRCESYQCCICYCLPREIYMCTTNGCGFICRECSIQMVSGSYYCHCPSCRSRQFAEQESPDGRMFYGVRNREAELLVEEELKQGSLKGERSLKRQREA